MMEEDRYEKSVRMFAWSMFCFGLLFLVAILTACTEHFRYPCQDPKNWERDECRRPLCAVAGTCPDQLNRPSDMKSEREP